MSEKCKHDNSGPDANIPTTSTHDTRATTDFIPSGIAPDNWPYFADRCNPLCSKGVNGSDDYYYDE